MELKQKLKELRTSRRLTQEEVAEALGVSAQTVSKWERGLLSPDIYLLPKIVALPLLNRLAVRYVAALEQ